MKMNNIPFVCIVTIAILATACKAQKKTSKAKGKMYPAYASDIELYNKPVDTIKKYVVAQRWQLVYSTGGMTGKDVNTFPDTYYIFGVAGKMTTEKGGEKTESAYTWKNTRDIFTGDSTYVISGPVQWKVESIIKDTLKISDNYVDGYYYSLIRAK